jgi:hypothetical protein
MLLIDDILLAPLKGIIFLGKKIDDLVQKELSDTGRIKERLMELQLKFEMDEISMEEYDQRETELLEMIERIQKEKENQQK